MKKNTFIDFILDVQKNPQLAKDFLDIKSAADLKAFFDEHGYDEISLDDCDKILEARDSLVANFTPSSLLGY